MMKMLIKLDEDKIRREKKYDINKINAYLTSAFDKRGMTKDEDDWYINGNFSNCGSLIINLSEKDWFMDNEPCLINMSLDPDTLLIPKIKWETGKIMPLLDEDLNNKVLSLLN